MKFGIIGAGMIGHFHAKAITAMTGGELQSVFDLRIEAAEKSQRNTAARHTRTSMSFSPILNWKS